MPTSVASSSASTASTRPAAARPAAPASAWRSSGTSRRTTTARSSSSRASARARRSPSACPRPSAAPSRSTPPPKPRSGTVSALPMTNPQTSVLLVEDEDSFIDALTVGLKREGFRVTVARDGAEALDLFETSAPDLVLLDVMLPKVSGIDVCREIRSRSSVPIIMVTAKSAEIDTVVGLEVGADDYITKPYRLRELVARIRAVLRRQAAEAEPVPSPSADAIVVGEVVLDPDRHEVVIRGEPVTLPLKEFELLELLLENAGRAMKRETLIDQIWGGNYFGDTKTLDVHIKRLRAKVEPDPASPAHIVTIRGFGY